jgi:carbonic anhydrase
MDGAIGGNPAWRRRRSGVTEGCASPAKQHSHSEFSACMFGTHPSPLSVATTTCAENKRAIVWQYSDDRCRHGPEETVVDEATTECFP